MANDTQDPNDPGLYDTTATQLGHSGGTPPSAPGTEPTLAATSGAPAVTGAAVSATDATIATGAAGPRELGASVGLDHTMAFAGSGSKAPDAPEAARPRVVIRAGGTEDYHDLGTVDPQRYVVGREIARGGMGRIMTARDRRLGRPVAIKELLIESVDLRARFEREARITAKLQHPSIVNLLEAGAWPGGEPFYVMKLVTGESLDKVIAGRQTLDARLALLPNVIAAVDALAYAHNVRVIHRDLKPANVLVGEYGETVVIDWGLAKDLADTSGAPDVSVGPYRALAEAPGETLAGEVMGTPAYMPPEQAEGAPVDERADVYALGAMLYHVLVGAPPYTGKTSDMILDAVIAGPPPPIDARTPGVPPDLVTIVNKAMAPAAADRYPTAKGLADDLKKFQTGQLVGAHHYSAWQLVRRWIRRHRAPVAVAAVATVLLGALGVVSLRGIVREQARTDQQRHAAEQGRGEAEELMSFMQGDLRDKLTPLNQLPLLDVVAQKAVAYYVRRGENLSDAELGKLALARRNLGDVLSAQGNADGALAEYRASLAIAETLATKDPMNADRQRALSVSHEKVGDVLLNQGETAAALATYRASLAIAETLAAKDPVNADRQRDLSVAHEKVGDVLRAQGDAAGSLAAYRADLAIAQTLAAKDPTNTDRQRDLSVSYENVGDALSAQGDAAGALAAYRADLAIAQTLAAKDPTNADRRRDLAASHGKVGNVVLAQGDFAGALAAYRASLSIAETLAAKDPTNADRQADLSVSHYRVGNALLAQGEAAGALAEFRASLAIYEALAAKDPTNDEWQWHLAVGHVKVGDVRFAQEDAEGALAEYRPSLVVFEKLAAKDPTNADRKRDLAASHDKVGDVLLAQPRAASALAEYRAYLAISETLAAKDPMNDSWQADLSVSHDKVGNALLALGDLAGALGEYRASLAIVQRLASKDPTNDDVRSRVASLAAKVARCCGAKRTNRPR